MSLPLHPLEKKLLASLSEKTKPRERVDFEKASEYSELSPDQLRRAIEWLRSKNLIAVKDEST
ncbi:MAG: phenylalanine--tRNA ligase subunit alpha, partial [Nitrososphaerales archaeon]